MDDTPSPTADDIRASRWEVRVPLRYGSKRVAYYADERTARNAAEQIEATRYPGVGLQIHTNTRTIYVNHPED